MTYNPLMPARPDTRPAPDSDASSASIGPAPILSSAERSVLRAQAHALSPVVMIGDAGLTDAVAAETDRALSSHGLIKIRVQGDDRAARAAMAIDLSQRLGCALVQSIGKMLVLWRPLADAPQTRTPIRRRVATPPKKLAAEGKPAPAKRARPGVPRAEPAVPAATRLRPAPRAARVMGPGSRTARGALNTSITPVNRGQGAGNTPAEPNRRAGSKRPQPVGLNAPVRSPARSTTGKQASGARGAKPAAKPRSGMSAPVKPRSAGKKSVASASSARSPAPAPRRSSSGTRPATGSARPGSRTRGPRRAP